MGSLYKPLSESDPSEIRLVKIYPGEFGQVPRCELSHASLASPKSDDAQGLYTSLSYTWGNPHGTASIRLNGIEHAVTHNLYSFLQHMQTMLLRIAHSLPPMFHKHSFMRHLFLHKIFMDPHFPRDMPSTDKTVLDSYVRRHLRAFFKEMEVDHIDTDDLYLDSSPGEPAQCFLHFWIDALCINQDDLDEKSVQVARMREIYERAPSMLIWLDDHVDPMPNAKAAMDLLYDIYKEVEPWLEGREDNVQATHRVTADSFLTPRVGQFEHLRELLSREWFSRSWIIQELALTKVTQIVFVGFQSIPWRQLSILLPITGEQMLGYKFEYHHRRVGFRVSIQQLKSLLEVVKISKALKEGDAETKTAQNLQSLLRAVNGNFTATNPRDLLYALLGLLGTGPLPQELHPDYNLPLEKVFHQYEIYMIKNTQKFGIGSCYRRNLEGVPTWVTDWRTYHSPKQEVDWTDPDLHHIELSGDGNHLTVDGLRLGVVAAVCYTRTFAVGDDGSSVQERAAEEESEDSQDLEQKIEELRTLKRAFVEHLPRTNPGMTPADFQKEWERFWLAYDDPRLRPQVEMIEESRTFDEEEFLSGIGGPWFGWISGKMRSALGSGVAITSTGKLLACWRRDERIQMGDIVWVLKGVDQPCLLRPAGSLYSLIGQLSMTSLRPSESTKEHVERVTII